MDPLLPKVSLKMSITRFARYVLAGFGTFMCEYASFLGLYYVLKAPVVAANTLSFCLAVAIGFILNRIWVFRSGAGQGWRQFIQFTLLALLNLGITNVSLPVLQSAGIEPALAKLGLMALIAVWNFVIMRNIVFKPETE